MMKFLALLALCLFVTINAQTYHATCQFDDIVADNLVGNVWIEDDSETVTLTFEVTGDALSDEGNAVHIHQTGIVSGETCSADHTGGHYNPVLNYGELSGKAGTFTADEAANMTMQFTDISLSGPYTFLGRSLVIHDNSGARIGCCNVILNDPSNAPTSDSVPTPLPLAACGLLVLNQTETGVTIWGEGNVNFTFTNPACDIEGEYYDFDGMMVIPAGTIVGGEIAAGTNLRVQQDTADPTLYCCTIALKNYQPNVADSYVPPQTSEEEMVTEGDVTEGDVTEGDVTEGDVTEDDVTEDESESSSSSEDASTTLLVAAGFTLFIALQ